MRLLIIEDEIKINNALAQGFREEGFIVESAFNGVEATDFTDKQVYDCLILDIMLPKKDGLTFLKELRTEKDETPVIILSAKDEVEDKISGFTTGADDYLAKPFSFNELLLRVKAIIKRSSTNQIILTADTVTFDPYKKLVKRSNEEIHITGKDLLLLEYLMRNKGIVISEDKIIQHVWNYDEEVNSNVVASHIKNLRIKIDKAFPNEKPILHTLRGLGYKIDG